MVTESKKPGAAPKKAAAKPKAPAKKAAASKPRAKPKTTVTTKTGRKAVAPANAVAARRVGEMVYNDELLESISEAVLLGEAALESLLPDIKNRLFDYDIYMVSFLEDEELDEIARAVSAEDAAAVRPMLDAIRENARTFVDIATGHNSVRAYIDRALRSDRGDTLFIEGEYCLKGASPETCRSFLTLF